MLHALSEWFEMARGKGIGRLEDHSSMGVVDQWRAFFHAIDVKSDGGWIGAVLVGILVLGVCVWKSRKHWTAQMTFLVLICKVCEKIHVK
jgi:hypothetical protein